MQEALKHFMSQYQLLSFKEDLLAQESHGAIIFAMLRKKPQICGSEPMIMHIQLKSTIQMSQKMDMFICLKELVLK